MKNIVFIPNVDFGDGRSKPYKYSIESWKKWCDKNNCDLIVFDTPLTDPKYMKLTWQRYYVLEMLENSNIEYDQVLMVDADTIVHPDTPNFFEMTDGKLTAVHNEGSYDWICRSIENYNKHLFPGKVPFKYWEYVNTGFLIFNKKHKKFLEEFLNFYKDNRDIIDRIQETYHVGTCQPVMNYFARIKNVEVNLLPYGFNMTDLPRKEILDEELTMTKVGWIYHFCAIPQHIQKQTGNVEYWMKKTYEHFHGPL